jgi:hypothetical protein
MDHLHVAPRRWYYVMMLIGSLGFVAGGIFLVTRPGLQAQLAGWPSIVFFGFGSFIFIQQIIDARPRMIIDDRGVMDRTLGIGMIPWQDITGARVKRTQNHPFICLELKNEKDYLRKLKPIAQALAKTNVSMGFNAINLNLSGVDADPEAVCALILAKIEANEGER